MKKSKVRVIKKATDRYTKVYFTLIMHDRKSPFNLELLKDCNAVAAEFDIKVSRFSKDDEALENAIGKNVLHTLRQKAESTYATQNKEQKAS